MSFQSIITERVAALTSLVNAISTNAKKIEELTLTTSKSGFIHVSENGISKKLAVSELTTSITDLENDIADINTQIADLYNIVNSNRPNIISIPLDTINYTITINSPKILVFFGDSNQLLIPTPDASWEGFEIVIKNTGVEVVCNYFYYNSSNVQVSEIPQNKTVRLVCYKHFNYVNGQPEISYRWADFSN